MRSILRNLFVLLVVLSATTATYANIYPTVKLVTGKTLIVNLNDWSNSVVEVTIKEVLGGVVYNDQFQSGGKKFNLDNLPAGKYELIIESNTKKAIQDLEVQENGIVVESDKAEIIFKPMLKVNGNNLDFNHLTLGRDFTISISDKRGVFFTKKFEGEQKVNKKFDITSLPKGEYTAIVSGENQYEVFYFTK